MSVSWCQEANLSSTQQAAGSCFVVFPSLQCARKPSRHAWKSCCCRTLQAPSAIPHKPHAVAACAVCGWPPVLVMAIPSASSERSVRAHGTHLKCMDTSGTTTEHQSHTTVTTQPRPVIVTTWCVCAQRGQAHNCRTLSAAIGLHSSVPCPA